MKGKFLIFFIIFFSVSYNFVKFFELTVDVKVKKTIIQSCNMFCFFPKKDLNPGHTEDELGITNISLHQKKVCHPHFQVCSIKCEEDILFTGPGICDKCKIVARLLQMPLIEYAGNSLFQEMSYLLGEGGGQCNQRHSLGIILVQ